MPLIKVHISTDEAPSSKPLLTKRLREIMVEKLQIDEKIGQVVLYEADPQFRGIHFQRSSHFVFIEVLLYPGRTQGMKEAFMKALVEETSLILKLDTADINCCLQEITQDNWYGGIRHKFTDELKPKE